MRLCLGLLGLLSACSPLTVTPDARVDAPDALIARVCLDAELDAVATDDFEHTSSYFSSLGSPHHLAEDVLTTKSAAVAIRAKFSYGPLRDDLEDERVEVFVGDCAGVQYLGELVTDDDGVAEGWIDPADLPSWGTYPLFFRVVGDGTITRSTLRILPEGTHLTVFDIDGTLTLQDSELFIDMASELFDGSYVPEPRASATEITQARADQGYEILYLTGRPYWLQNITTEWIDTMDLAAGTLHLTHSNAEALPFESGVGDYKADYLIGLQDQGFVIDFAYGNTSTDVYGYAEAGVDPGATRIMGPKGGDQGTIPGGEGFTSHVDEVLSELPVNQPFL